MRHGYLTPNRSVLVPAFVRAWMGRGRLVAMVPIPTERRTAPQHPALEPAWRADAMWQGSPPPPPASGLHNGRDAAPEEGKAVFYGVAVSVPPTIGAARDNPLHMDDGDGCGGSP
jgi:hypothetical protein